MFIGIVTAVSRVETASPSGDNADAGACLSIDAGGLPLADVALGDSTTIQGACMTVVAEANNHFEVDVSCESFSRTVRLKGPGEVNLEEALRLADRIEGHLMPGHVDSLGTVAHFVPVNESHELRVRAPAELGEYLAYKGSAVVNDVSLTVNTVRNDADGYKLLINLTPHTVAVATLKHLKAGNQVNLGIDLITRYVERMLTHAAIGLSVGAQPPAAV